MSTRVKICGITRLQDARLAEKLGAWAIGLNFYEKSPRAISPADAWKLRQKLTRSTKAVGVFVNWKPDAVIALAKSLKVSAAQLHGDESPTEIAECAESLEVIKAFRVGPGFKLTAFKKFRRASYFLLDAAKRGQFGGTGEKFDWSIAQKAAASHKIILAGGLTPENVGDAILTVRPYAVDVASGVESHPGIKDPGKLREFLAEVSRANLAVASLSRE